MRRIAVISCAKSRQSYTCQAVEMYQKSKAFQARQIFMDEAYDEWYINTRRFGFMKPEMVIEPYDGNEYIASTATNSFLRNSKAVVSPEAIEEWLELVKSQFPNRDGIELHTHLSMSYVKHLKKIFPNVIHYKPEVNLNITAWKYIDATKMLLNNTPLDECLEFLKKKTIKTKPKEEAKWFYHMDGEEFYGTSHTISYHKKVKGGGAYNLSHGMIQMYSGWVINKDLLPHITKYPSGRYRLAKGLSKTDYKMCREGLKEEILKLNKRFI